MGVPSSKPVIIAKPRHYNLRSLNVPYAQLQMIRVLQSNFNYEVKGTMFFQGSSVSNGDSSFKCFTVRTDSSEIYSYGDESWKISFHTHPDATAVKYGVRYFSPPSVDDVLEIYQYSFSYVPSTMAKSLGEISVIFANEGIYLLQVDRDKFDRFNNAGMPIELLEQILRETFTEFMTNHLKSSLQAALGPDQVLDMENPQVTLDQYYNALKALSAVTTTDFGFNMNFYSWTELEKDGLNIKAYDYFLDLN